MSDDFDDDEKKIPEGNDNWNVIPFDQDTDVGDLVDAAFDEVETNEKYHTVEKETDHVLEDVFDIEAGTTMVPYVEREPTVLCDHETYDEKDKEIENQLQEVIDCAMEAFENTSEAAEDVEPQYKARNQEVAAQFLTTALQAISQKSSIKQQKDKLEKMIAKGGPGGTVTNNVIVDRNDLLRALQSGDKADPIEGECSSE
jgi:Lhr-like helicase